MGTKQSVCLGLEWDRRAAAIFKHHESGERSAVDWKAVGCEACFRRGPAWSNLHESLIFILSHSQLITHESSCEIEMVTWFTSKWKFMIGGDGSRLRGSLLRPMTLQILFKQCYSQCGCHPVLLTDCWELLDCLTALMTDWACVLLCLTLQQCLIS